LFLNKFLAFARKVPPPAQRRHRPHPPPPPPPPTRGAAVVMPTWEFSVGDSVQLTKGTPDNGCLGFGDVGSVCQVAEESDDDEPYEVINESGKKWWYEDGQLAKASGNTKKPSTKKAQKKPAKKKQKTVAAAQDDENSEEQVEVAEAEGDGVLAGISDDDESDDEPAQEDAGDDDFDASNDEDGDDDEEFTTEKPKATRKRRREAPEENAGDNTEAPQGGTGTRSGRPRGNAFAPMDDQPIADPRVDPYCEINERQIEGKVVEFGEDGSPEQELYSVTLRKAPTGLATTTRTAVIQVIQFSRGGVARFCTFARWGAAGADGQKKATEHSYLDAAVKKFAEHYHSLTGNDWSARHNGFLKKEGKFEVVEIDVSANVADLSMTSDDRYGVAHPADEGVPLKLAPELASVVRDLSDFGKMYRQLEERGVELGRLPVCRFTKKHIRQGFTALKSLQFILSDIPGLDALSEEETAEIVTATYQFYAACPHVEEPDKITSSDQVAYLSETLTIMAEVEKAAETIRFERTVQTDVHPLDRDFALFKSRVELLDVDSSERNLIEGMISGKPRTMLHLTCSQSDRERRLHTSFLLASERAHDLKCCCKIPDPFLCRHFYAQPRRLHAQGQRCLLARAQGRASQIWALCKIAQQTATLAWLSDVLKPKCATRWAPCPTTLRPKPRQDKWHFLPRSRECGSPRLRPGSRADGIVGFGRGGAW
jgi:hypothetical protein